MSTESAALTFTLRDKMYYYGGYMVIKKRVQRATSENARKVALDVISAVSQGKRVNKRKIQMANGYTLQSAISNKAIRTDTYKETIANTLERMEKERTRLLIELSNRDITKERYMTMVDAMDKLTKNSQLLGGKATENIATQVQIVRYEDTQAAD